MGWAALDIVTVGYNQGGEIMSEVIVEKAVSLTLAALMTLSQWFSDGITNYQKKSYDKAVQSFTKVIEDKAKPNPLYETALYWRSQSYIQLKKTDEAAADLKTLLEAAPEGSLVTLAVADYKTVTGKDWDDVDLSSPEKAWSSMTRAVVKRDMKALRKCLTGEIAQETERMFAKPEKGDRQWAEMSEVLSVKLTGVRYNKTKDKALVMFREPRSSGSGREEKLVMEKINGGWKLSGESHSADETEFLAAVKPASAAAANITLTAQEQKDIEALISQLGSTSSKERKDANDKLRALGPKAAKLLEKAKSNPDPEVALQAKTLLDGM